MPVRRTRNAGNSEQQSREMRLSKLTMFIQQFEKEAQERMSDLAAKMETMAATVDKINRVETMKRPSSLQNTLIGDLISEEEVSASEVSIAMKNESPEMQPPLRRAPRRRLNSTPDQSTPVQRTSSKTSKGGNGTKKTRILAGSNSTGNLRGSTVAGKKTSSRVTKTNDHTVPTKKKLRSVVSTGDLHCSMAGSAAHVTVTTAHGQTVSFSEETKDEVNLDLLDDVAWCQIQRLTNLMEYLSRRSPCPR